MEANKYQPVEVTFNFRKNREGIKRDALDLNIPVPTAETIVEILQDESADNKKARALVIDAVQAVVIGHVRSEVDANENFNQETLDAMVEQLTLTAIANLPRSARSSISKDELEQFAAAYIAIMPELVGIKKQAAEAAGTLIVNRVKAIVGNDGALRKLQERIQEFVEKAPDDVVTEHSNAITYILSRLEEALGINFDAEAL